MKNFAFCEGPLRSRASGWVRAAIGGLALCGFAATRLQGKQAIGRHAEGASERGEHIGAGDLALLDATDRRLRHADSACQLRLIEPSLLPNSFQGVRKFAHGVPTMRARIAIRQPMDM